MSYVDTVLQPGETVRARARPHWIVYLTGLVLLIAGLAVYVIARGAITNVLLLDGVAAALALIGLYLIARAWFRQLGTEIVVTDRRVIRKIGLIGRRTIEMNMDKVESVEVDQSIFARMFNYGTIRVHGTGERWEALRTIDHPLDVRNAITAR